MEISYLGLDVDQKDPKPVTPSLARSDRADAGLRRRPNSQGSNKVRQVMRASALGQSAGVSEKEVRFMPARI